MQQRFRLRRLPPSRVHHHKRPPVQCREVVGQKQPIESQADPAHLVWHVHKGVRVGCTAEMARREPVKCGGVGRFAAELTAVALAGQRHKEPE